MLRAIAVVILVVLAALGLILAVESNENAGRIFAVSLSSQPAPPAFSRTGTLAYYPNNLGLEVPYLVFKMSTSSGTETRTLSFTSTSRCQTSAGSFSCPLIASALSYYYGGGPIRVDGTLDEENVLVASVSPA